MCSSQLFYQSLSLNNALLFNNVPTLKRTIYSIWHVVYAGKFARLMMIAVPPQLSSITNCVITHCSAHNFSSNY